MRRRHQLHRARIAVAEPYVESFGGRLCDEQLGVEAFRACWKPRCWWRTGGSSTRPAGPAALLRRTSPRRRW
jgi:hypothetical protein